MEPPSGQPGAAAQAPPPPAGHETLGAGVASAICLAAAALLFIYNIRPMPWWFVATHTAAGMPTVEAAVECKSLIRQPGGRVACQLRLVGPDGEPGLARVAPDYYEALETGMRIPVYSDGGRCVAIEDNRLGALNLGLFVALLAGEAALLAAAGWLAWRAFGPSLAGKRPPGA